jgi:ribonuclease HII
VLDKKYPGYDFANSKGYIGAKHKEAIKQHGLIKGVHRFSYHLNFPKEFSQISILDLKL